MRDWTPIADGTPNELTGIAASADGGAFLRAPSATYEVLLELQKEKGLAIAR